MSHPTLLPLGRPAVPRQAHLIGIAGAGMRALAAVLLGRGWRLSGSDPVLTADDPLHCVGVQLFDHHAAANLPPEADLVIASSAVAEDNPELRQAAARNIPRLSYAEMLGRLMHGRTGVAVAGTHGKSTTAAMAAQILVEAGKDPTVVVGAAPLGAVSGGRAGRGDLVLVEACEYRANFLHLQPHYAAVLNVEPDHFDCYASVEELHAAFSRFIALVPRDGLLVVPQDCPVIRRLASGAACRQTTFGMTASADWSAARPRAWRGCYQFELGHRGRTLGVATLRVPGRHNVLNALAAAALAHAAGATPEQIVGGLGRFRGLGRRLESLGTWGGVLLVDDYAHHPTEVAASLAAVRQMAPRRRLWCVFQPHQASRTAHLLDELAESLQNAETVLVAEIFRAREGPVRPGDVTAVDLARAVRAKGVRAPELHATDEIRQYLMTQMAPGDVLVTMGAGDIGRIGYGFMERFRKSRAAG